MSQFTILGLDLGPSSIGWALFNGGADGVPTELIDLGVRHFEEVAEPKTGVLLNKKRRTKRGMRKNIRRRRERLDSLLAAMRQGGLAPTGQHPFAESGVDPLAAYRTRARAVEEPVSLEELGRAIYHLARRRGFLSNRGTKFARIANLQEVANLLAEQEGERESTERGKKRNAEEEEKAKEEGVILKEITELRTQLDGRTLGQYFLQELEAGRGVRGRHTHRDMYEDEFERIWSCQSSHHPQLTQELRARIYRAIFHQRPLKEQHGFKGFCSMEPQRLRAQRGQLVAQRYRYWQDIVNLKMREPDDVEHRPLTREERLSLADFLDGRVEATWEAVRKHLQLAKGTDFNLKKSKDQLRGNSTAVRLAAIATDWGSMDEAARERLVETLLTISDRGKLYLTMREKFGYDVETAYRLAKLKLEDGTAALSSRAMRRILQALEQRPETATMYEAQLAAGYTIREVQQALRIERAPNRLEITNPRVRKGLAQLRRVMNALIAKYGRPDIVRIELARDLSLTKKEKEGLDKAKKQLERENAEADRWLRDQGIQNPTRTDRFWYRLARQCGWVCPYTGQPIPQELASTSRFQIEHIVPYSRCLDDSFNNLTLCESQTNQEKGDRTPWEAFGQTAAWEDMEARVQQWRGIGTGRKKSLFLRREAPPEDQMVARQLNETRYMSCKAMEFLEPVVGRVEVTKGGATAMLREHWGLFHALNTEGEKNRDDLRHHAVDAVAIAFTTRSVFMKATAHRKRHADGRVGKITPLSAETVPAAPEWLHDALKQRLASLVVSHEATRKIRDAFHEETAYGLRDPLKREFQYRKNLVDLTAPGIEDIVDGGLRKKAEDILKATGLPPKEAFKEGIPMGTTVARRARIVKPMPKAALLEVPEDSPTKYYPLGNNHHVAIFEDENGKRMGVFVSMLDAARRMRRDKAKHPVDTNPPSAGLRFVMWLAVNDTVFLPDDEGPGLYRVAQLKAANNVICLYDLRRSSPSGSDGRLFKTPNTLRAIKVEVDPIGGVREVAEGKL